MKIPNSERGYGSSVLSLARIVSEDSQLSRVVLMKLTKSSKDS